MFEIFKTICNFMWLLMTNKCKFVNILPKMPNMNDNNIALLHNNNTFIDYNTSRYMKCEVIMQILFEFQTQNNNNTLFRKLRDNSDIEVL